MGCNAAVFVSKIMRLVNKYYGNRERDKIIERILRKAATERLRLQVEDLYKIPEVNQELRQRLPRANKSDPFLNKTAEEIFIDSLEDGVDNMSLAINDSLDAEIDAIAESVQTISPEKCIKKTGSRRSLKFGRSNSENDKDALKDSRPKTPENIPPVSQTYTFPSASFHGYGTPYLYPYQPHPIAQSTPFQSPLQYRPNNSHQPSVNQHINMDTSHGPLRFQDFSHLPSSENSNKNAVNEHLYHDDKGADSGVESSPYDFHSRLHAFTPGGMNYNPIETSSTSSVTSSSQVLPVSVNNASQNKQITLLLTEINILKQQNEKLSKSLADRNEELLTARLALELKESEMERKRTNEAAELIEKIEESNKKYENAMMGRIKLANEERDEAIERWKQVQGQLERLMSSEISDPDDEMVDHDEIIDQYMSDLTSSENFDIDERTQKVVNRLDRKMKRHKEITAEEIKIILDQRNSAMSKCKKLQQSLFKVNSSQLDSNKERNLRCKLNVVEQERDILLAKMNQLQDENQTLRLYYSLHKSLAPDGINRDRKNNISESNMTTQGRKEESQVENSDLVVLLRAKNERLEKDLEKSKDALRRSEKHVNILKKKLADL